MPLRLFGNSEFHALGRVDFVHGLLHTYIRVNICDEGLEDLVAVFAHSLLQSVLDREGKIFLCLEDGVQFQCREFTAHNIVHVCGDLLLRVCEGVEGIVDLFPDDLILNTHDGLYEDVILRLGFYADVKLLNTC